MSSFVSSLKTLWSHDICLASVYYLVCSVIPFSKKNDSNKAADLRTDNGKEKEDRGKDFFGILLFQLYDVATRRQFVQVKTY